MAFPKIVVTAPASRIGSWLVSDLLKAGAAIRLIARDPSRLAPDVRERAEIVAASYGGPRVVGVSALGRGRPLAGRAGFVEFGADGKIQRITGFFGPRTPEKAKS